jgi:hypothetical protein
MKRRWHTGSDSPASTTNPPTQHSEGTIHEQVPGVAH